LAKPIEPIIGAQFRVAQHQPTLEDLLSVNHRCITPASVFVILFPFPVNSEQPPMNLNRMFRNYHRWLAVVFALPLLTTIVSGILFTIGVEWFHQQQLAEVLMRIHTLQLFGLGKVFPLLIGVGLIGLLVTGLSMTNLFRPHRRFPHHQNFR